VNTRARRWLAATLGTVALLALATAGTVYAASQRRLARRYDVKVTLPGAVASDSATLARGAHLVQVATCTLCHGADLGGSVYVEDAMVTTMAGPNLTTGRGGVGATRSDSDFVRAIRHGVRPDGRSLIVMPSEVFVHIGDRDLASIIAWIRHAPAVDRVVPASGFGPVGRALLAAGKLNILVAPKTPAMPIPPGVESGATAEYGRYLADITGCHGCHGYKLSGGRVAGPPGLPPAANLTPSGAIAAWSEDDLRRAMREGRRPDGSALNEFMPWRNYSAMTDEEVRALWLYLRSVPPRDFGNK
jgi:cytochrome c553